jgi:hypothetical protein
MNMGLFYRIRRVLIIIKVDLICSLKGLADESSKKRDSLSFQNLTITASAAGRLRDFLPG